MTDVLGDTYRQARWDATSGPIVGEPEAALTTPVSQLFEGLAEHEHLGRLILLRETHLDGVRPDFGALIEGVPCGWVELKAPGHSLDGSQWKGREARQWELLAQLDALIVTNGEAAQLYLTGEPAGSAAPLPAMDDDIWDPRPLADLLRQFVEARPRPIVRVSELSTRLAPLARMLRERLEEHLDTPGSPAAITEAWQAWKMQVHEGASKKQFANDLAQVVSYSLAIAALRGGAGADVNKDNRISLTEARQVLSEENAVLAAAMGPVLGVAGLHAAIAVEIGALERLAAAVDHEKIAKAHDSRGEPWLWFYEDFLATYDPAARKEAGVYYTPVDVVQAQVRLCDYILTNRLNRPLGFGDPKVVTLDPATGSGTYPLAVIDRAEQVALEERGPAGPRQIADSLGERLLAFEVLPGPYAVAHLRIGQRLAEMADQLLSPPHTRVYLTDTLDDPDREVPTLGLWGDQAVLAKGRASAAEVKRKQPVTVVIGNPPYKRRTRQSGGGFVVHAPQGRALFDDVIEGAQRAGVIFSAQASLYNDYVYFWRWALWKAFEQDPKRPAVVSFITASSWLKGPGFVGLRALARDLADEIWVMDLGGEGRGNDADPNVFAIQTPVAVVTLYRAGKTQTKPAAVYYRRIYGDTAASKLEHVAAMSAPGVDPAWSELEVAGGAPLLPSAGDGDWDLMPALTDLFPWQQPGAMFNRAWPVSPSAQVLKRRWEALLAAATAGERADLFVTAATGRTIHTKVAKLPQLSSLGTDSPHQPIVRFAHRSFDRQWTFEDPRLANLERPSLWGSLSDRQIFLSSMTTNPLGAGPALTVSTAPPDKHHFRGSFGGKDVLPLFRDRNATSPNLPKDLLDMLGKVYHQPIHPEDVAAYVYALLAHPGYEDRFRKALATPGPRVPITADVDLFNEAVDIGRRLLWLQTYAERFRDPAAGRDARVPSVSGLGWTENVTQIPENLKAVSYEPDTQALRIGDGQVAGVRPEVWGFTVSGLRVVERWIAARTAVGVGKSASTAKTATPLDKIRPLQWEDEWNVELLELLRVLTHTVESYPAQEDLLERIVTSPLIPAVELPQPTKAERSAPTGA